MAPLSSPLRGTHDSVGAYVGDPINCAFSLEVDPRDNTVVKLSVLPPGSSGSPDTLWRRQFNAAGDREAVLEKVRDKKLDLVFLGRLTMIFGSDGMDATVDEIVSTDRTKRKADEKEAAEQAQKHLIVNLYAPEGKNGRHVLELERESRNKADWKVTYDRAVERDRMCDWMRWQRERFLGFLDYAAEHGDEALARLLTNEMFETERRVKKDGRGAGGMRPLRMWRGD